MKKFATAIVLAMSILPVWTTQATPKVSIMITAPKGTSGADAVTAKIFKGVTWLPCVSAETEFGIINKNKILSTATKDKLQFDLSVTNEDVGKDGTMDYDLYVVFINHGAKSGVGTYGGGGKGFYFATAPSSFFTPTLTIYDNDESLNNSGPPPPFMAASSFISDTFNSTLFGMPIDMDTPMINQGTWSILAILATPSAITSGSAIQDPRNWEAWAIQYFILGSPFSTLTGVGNGILPGTGICK